MWFEPGQYPDTLGVLGGAVIPVGFEKPPGAEIGSDLHVLNDHSYCCQMGAKVCADGEPPMELAGECKMWHKARLEQRSRDAERLGVPLIISEFGACLTEGPCTQEIN